MRGNLGVEEFFPFDELTCAMNAQVGGHDFIDPSVWPVDYDCNMTSLTSPLHFIGKESDSCCEEVVVLACSASPA
jgi:hypothetical protein